MSKHVYCVGRWLGIDGVSFADQEYVFIFSRNGQVWL